jgi:hypothetical protein
MVNRRQGTFISASIGEHTGGWIHLPRERLLTPKAVRLLVGHGMLYVDLVVRDANGMERRADYYPVRKLMGRLRA